jgi:hypothetical protein
MMLLWRSASFQPVPRDAQEDAALPRGAMDWELLVFELAEREAWRVERA